MSIFHCYSEGISMTFILSCTTLMCFQMNCSVTSRCVSFDKRSQHPQEAKWLKFRDQGIVDSSFLRTILSTTEMGFSHQLSCSSILIEHLLIHWPYQLTIPFRIHSNSQYRWLGFDCEDIQIVIGHSMYFGKSKGVCARD